MTDCRQVSTVAAAPSPRQKISVPPASSAAPLSDDEYETLADFLDEHGNLDIDGLLGFFNALAVAPSLLPPATWLPFVLPEEQPEGLGRNELTEIIGLVLRQYNDVLDALEHNSLVAPPSDDEETCARFAGGYAEGAALDSAWIDNDDRWSFASPLAYLGDKRDLVPEKELAKLDADSGAKALIRKQLSAIIGTTHDVFKKYRRVSLEQPPLPHAVRVGRNAPCPCGSGKKYKRCCAVSPQPRSTG